mmetsp:Transcript_6375/g.13033  ORF Transcript_6375/g.13033 Transcript_6375/m.13033 type:complete len:449 (-) Transcript_6375:105-1451(-)
MVKRIAGFPAVKPEAVGLSPKPFEAFRQDVRRETDELQCMSGAAHIVLHKGQCVFSCTEGWADRKRRVRFGLDTICKLHGNSKPLVQAALLTLVDEGKVRLSDPVSKYIKFSSRVATGKQGAAAKGTRKAKPEPTLRNLLTMTAGLGYEHTPAYKPVMKRVRSGEISDLTGLSDAIADLPLQAKPGSRYEYSFCTDIMGHVCEAVSGLPLDRFMERQLLKPLGMKDTHFVVPPQKRRRMAVLYDAQLKKPKAASGSPMFELKPWSHPEKAPGIMSAGGGVLSYEDPGMLGTARDYAQFCQMLLNDGVAPDGKRILKESTARSIWADALAIYARSDGRLPGWNDADGPGTKGGFWDYTGCGLLHTHLVFDKAPSGSGPPRRAHSMWMGGGGGTYWVADKSRGLACLSFTQAFGGRKGEEDGLGPRGNDVAPPAREAFDQGKVDAKKGRR